MTDTMNFAPEFDAPIDYMRRTRDYYLALGYLLANHAIERAAAPQPANA